MTTVILAIGYVLAVPPLFRLRHAWTHRQWWMYAAELAGALLITLGWALRGGWGAVAINGAWSLIFGLGFVLWKPGRRGD